MRRAAALALAGLALAACAKQSPQPSPAPRAAAAAPAADSVTIALWRLDERGGTRVPDSGPFRLTGVAGPDTRSDFGRYAGGRLFTFNPQSWVHVPYNPVMESPRGFTVEAWLDLNSVGTWELTTIAARWSPVPNEQSWLFGVTGQNLHFPAAPEESPGTFRAVVRGTFGAHLVFAFQPDQAAAPIGWVSNAAVPVGRWTHVAATCDAEVVTLYINGRVDSQFAINSGIRRSPAPLVLGNVIDERRLTAFGGELRLDSAMLTTPWYALDGVLDEVRISNVPRTSFDSADVR